MAQSQIQQNFITNSSFLPFLLFCFLSVTTKDPDHISPTDFTLFLRDVDVFGFKFQVILTAKVPLDYFLNISNFHSAENLILHMAAIAISALTGQVICSLKSKCL